MCRPSSAKGERFSRSTFAVLRPNWGRDRGSLLNRFHFDSILNIMAVLIVLLGSWVILRGIGALGVSLLATWRDSARYALAIMFVFTATAHFSKMKHDLSQMVPSFFPRRLWLVYITGVLELLGAVGLLLPGFRSLAGVCLIALLCGMFMAKVNAELKGITLRGKPATPLWLRTPMQIFFIVLLWWSTRG